jgi:glycosyltransferase involved in cell wall biosynthesis
MVNQPGAASRPPTPTVSIGIWSSEVARRLVAAGHQVTVYASGNRRGITVQHHDGVEYRLLATLPDTLLSRVLRYLPASRGPRRPRLTSVLTHLGFAIQVAIDIRRHRPDLVHVQSQFPFTRVIRAFNRRVPIVLHLHNEWLSDLHPAQTAPAVRAADAVVTVSDHVTRRARLAHPAHAARILTIPNGVDGSAFGTGERGDADGFNVLYVGRVSPEKGLHTLIDAVVALAPDDDAVTLTLIGPHSVLPAEAVVRGSTDPRVRALSRWYGAEPYRSQLEKKIPPGLKSRVDWAGVVPYQDLPKAYAMASVLVNPSLSESFGMTVVEGMASGLPVIATRVGGQEELVADGTTGLLVDPEDPDQLADAIRRIRRDPDSAHQMGEAGRRQAQLYDWDRITQEALNLYSRLTVATTKR